MKTKRRKPESTTCSLTADLLQMRIARFVGVMLLSLCLVCTFCFPVPALATTEEDLADAKARYNEVQTQLDAIAAEYEALSKQQSDTLDQIEAVQKQITATQEQIDVREAELETHQEELAQFAVDTYKQDQTGFIDVLFEAETFESFVTSWEYISMINDKKLALIDDVRTIKAELSEEKASLESDKAQLEELKEAQAEQMTQMRAQQQEVTELLESLDEEVQELTEKNNAEIAARAAEAAANSYTGSTWTTPATLVVTGEGSASDVVASCYTTPSPGLNWCAAWVSNVFSAAGVGSYSGNACDMYNMYCYSSDLSELQPGMIVAVSSNPRGGSAGTIYGHVGIYIGDGIVMENIGYIAQTPISEWIDWYSSAVTPRWGWMGGVVLS